MQSSDHKAIKMTSSKEMPSIWKRGAGYGDSCRLSTKK